MSSIEILFACALFLMGLLIGLLKSYFSEKGKNLATKEDIESITEKIESVKANFQTSFVKSEAYISRQLKAYDELTEAIVEVRIHCFREGQQSEHAVPYSEIPQKSSFQRAMLLSELILKHEGFISKGLIEKINSFTNDVVGLGHMEMYSADSPEFLNLESYKKVLQNAETLMKDIWEDFSVKALA